jgi:hypothetical protein
MDLKISRKKSANQKSQDFCEMFVIFSLAYGFLFFVISISVRSSLAPLRPVTPTIYEWVAPLLEKLGQELLTGATHVRMRPWKWSEGVPRRSLASGTACTRVLHSPRGAGEGGVEG